MQKTDLESDLGSKSSALRPINLWRRTIVHLPVRNFQDRPDADLSIPPTHQEIVVWCASKVGFLWKIRQITMVLPPEFSDWQNYGRSVEAYDVVRLDEACEPEEL